MDKKKDPITIDLDNYEPSKEPVLKTEPGWGLCSDAMSDEEMNTHEIVIDFDNQPMAKEPMKGEVRRLDREALRQEQEHK